MSQNDPRTAESQNGAFSNAREGASSALRPSELLRRPVAARLGEPILAAIGLATIFTRIDDPAATRRLSIALAVFLVARLVVDTAPNLVVCGRLESEPFSERALRRSLALVKLKLAAVATLVLVLSSDGLSNPAASSLATHPLVLTAIALASYSLSAPVLLEHRGIPIARPSLGPVAGAFAFAVGALWFEPDPQRTLTLGAWCVSIGNAIAGSWQRYLAAARRIALVGSASYTTSSDPAGVSGELQRGVILERSLAVAPFVLLPIASAIADLVADARVPPLAALTSCLAAALPPILFDAKRPARRFRFAAYSLAVLLLAAASLAGDGAARPLLDTSLVLAAYPALNTLLARGARRSLIMALSLYVVAKAALLAHDPLAALPIAEGLLALFAMAAVLEHRTAP